MRNLLLFVLTICTTPLVSRAQLFGESRYTNETQEIILNQREYGVEKFTIRVERKVSSSKTWRDKYRYRFINDSTLQMREGLLSERYIIRNNEILEPEYEADSAWLANYNKDKIYTQSNISGFDTRRQYQLKGNDTILIREDAVKKGVDQTTMIHKYFVDTVWRIHKTIISQLSDSTSTTSYFVYQNDYWCKRLEISEKITHKGNQSNIMTQSIQRKCTSSEADEITQTDLSYRTVTRFYDEQGLIRMIEIDNPDTHFGYFAQLKVIGRSRKTKSFNTFK